MGRIMDLFLGGQATLDSSAYVLRQLAAGPYGAGRCAEPASDAGLTWLQLDALPNQMDGPNTFERVLGVLAGTAAELRIRLHHSESSGLAVCIGTDTTAVRDRLRNLIAPAGDVRPIAVAPALPGPMVVGIAFRTQAETARSDTSESGSFRLVERLAAVSGDWAVEMVLSGLAQPHIHEAGYELDELAEHVAGRLTSTAQVTTRTSETIVSAGWTRVQQWIDVLRGQLTQGGADGLWRVDIWATATAAQTVQMVQAALHGSLPGDQGRRAIAHDLHYAPQAPRPSSLLTTRDLAGMLAPPPFSLAGLRIRKAPPGNRRPDGTSQQIQVGCYWSTDLPASIALSDLEGHAFISGTTGSGKTTTLHRLLAGAWNDHGVPFLVLDPVKDEYSAVSSLFRGGVQVVSGAELSLNLMDAWPGEDPRSHVAQVAQAFRGSFSMPSPTPYVLTQLFDSIAMQPGGPAGATLYDVRDRVDAIVTSLGYAPEAQSNIRAALMTRLNVLLAPIRAHRFAWPDSDLVGKLFNRPTVVTLADLVDEEERSFVVLLLALATWARARRRRSPKSVEHLLVLEEAHRVLPEVSPLTDHEGGSAQRVSSQLLSSMLAEVRSLGEQVIVVDQSPSRVASDVLRNTNLKIVHRTVHPDDQAQIAGAIGLDPADSSLIGGLARGQAIVSTRQEPAPQTLSVAPARPLPSPAGASRVQRTAPNWPCCSRSEDHFRAWYAAARSDAPMALFLAACRVGDGSGRGVQGHVHDALMRVSATTQASGPCLAWAGLRRLLVREQLEGIHPDTAQMNRHLGALFELWVEKRPPSQLSAKDFEVPAITQRRCPECGGACTVRVPAWAIHVDGPRNGLQVLSGPRWRDEVAGLSQWLLAERKRLGGLLGAEGATTVLRCQTHQAARHSRLQRSDTDRILASAGLS